MKDCNISLLERIFAIFFIFCTAAVSKTRYAILAVYVKLAYDD